MSGIAVVTDSTSDLTPELIAQNRLRVVPMLVQFGQTAFRDGLDIDSRRLFAMVGAERRLPQTSSPNPAAFRDVFADAVADGSEAIYISLSTKLSAAMQNARIAAEMLPAGQVRTFDSANLSTGIGLLALLACDLAREGKSAGEILAALEQARPKIRTAFMIDTLEYLHMGGRCTGVQALVGSLLRLRPIISVTDGAMGVAAKIRGPRQKGLDWMLEQFAADAEQGLVSPERVFITHTGVPDDAAYMTREVRRILPAVKAVLETQAGSVVSSHCGPGTIGILYMLK